MKEQYQVGKRVVADIAPFGSFLKGTIVDSSIEIEVDRKCIFGPNFFIIEEPFDRDRKSAQLSLDLLFT